MTKLVIISDSHGKKESIRRILKSEQDCEAVFFLGDGLRDLESVLVDFPRLKVYSVAGNCDYGAPEPIDGLAVFDHVVIYYTHGHMYGVKYELNTITEASESRGADIALFGHTHSPHSEQYGPVFLFNPGSCGRCYTGPDTYGVLILDNGRISRAEHKEVPKHI